MDDPRVVLARRAADFRRARREANMDRTALVPQEQAHRWVGGIRARCERCGAIRDVASERGAAGVCAAAFGLRWKRRIIERAGGFRWETNYHINNWSIGEILAAFDLDIESQISEARRSEG